MDKPRDFISLKDELSIMINHKANELYDQIRTLNVDVLEMDPFCRNYFKECHSGRLIFSLRCSAQIIYDSIKLQDKKIGEITFLDYGAGLGTLFMLAAKLPFKQVLYNDHLPEWCNSAEVICNALNIPIRHFIKGDVDELIAFCKSKNILVDIFASRNVIEHIYDLNYFFKAISEAFPEALVYSTTTANFQNPAMRFKHFLLHRDVEKKYYLDQRRKLVREKIPGLNESEVEKVVKLSRGKALQDFDLSMKEYQEKGTITSPEYLHSNTCDSLTGVWAEHILSRNEYASIINHAGLEMRYTSGFWDTDYSNPVINVFGKLFNALIPMLGKSGVLLSPFVSIVAAKRLDNKH